MSKDEAQTQQAEPGAEPTQPVAPTNPQTENQEAQLVERIEQELEQNPALIERLAQMPALKGFMIAESHRGPYLQPELWPVMKRYYRGPQSGFLLWQRMNRPTAMPCKSNNRIENSPHTISSLMAISGKIPWAKYSRLSSLFVFLGLRV